MDSIPHNRATDKGWIFTLALRMSQLWDWFDKRQIDKHTVAAMIILFTFRITDWAMAYAQAQHTKSGVEIAAIIGAVMVPWSAVQTAAIKFYFDARS